MIAVLTHHWAKPGMFEKARALLDGNGAAQANSPGFVSRTTVLSMTDPSQITSFVVWESAEIYDQWKASPERKVTMAGAEDLWSNPPVSERFNVAG
ncbi:MAG: hypothetical protein F4Y50_10300 [Dehalococcoidia bacterium]|nr:hypothetical protein [Dehalococcoidia bacterium]